MGTEKVQDRLRFEPDYELATKRCLPDKIIVEALTNRIFDSFHKCTQRNAKSRWAKSRRASYWRHLQAINASSKSSEDRLPPTTVINTVSTMRSSRFKNTSERKTKEWYYSMSLPDDYTSRHDEVLSMLERFPSMWNETLELYIHGKTQSRIRVVKYTPETLGIVTFR